MYQQCNYTTDNIVLTINHESVKWFCYTEWLIEHKLVLPPDSIISLCEPLRSEKPLTTYVHT